MSDQAKSFVSSIKLSNPSLVNSSSTSVERPMTVRFTLTTPPGATTLPATVPFAQIQASLARLRQLCESKWSQQKQSVANELST